MMNNIYLETFLRTLFAIAVMFVLARLNGAKEISQLTFFDYIIGITAGSIGAELAINYDMDIGACLLGLAMFMLASLVMSLVTNKSILLRRALTGAPVVLVKNGEIMYSGLKKARFDINDLLRELRSQGYFDISAIDCVILETNGKLSVLPKSGERPATVTEQGLTVEQDTVPNNVIIDGKIIEGNLSAAGKSADELREELSGQGYPDLKKILLACYSDGELTVYEKKETKAHTVFQ